MDERQHHRQGYEFQRDDDDERGRQRYGMGEQMRDDDDAQESRSRSRGSWGSEARRGRERMWSGSRRQMQEPGRHRDWGEEEMRGRRGRASYPYGYDEDLDSPRGDMMRGEGRGSMSGRGDWERGFEGRGDIGRGWGGREEREFGGRGEMFGGRDESWQRGGGRMGGGGRYERWREDEGRRGWGQGYGYGPSYGGPGDYGQRYGQSYGGDWREQGRGRDWSGQGYGSQGYGGQGHGGRMSQGMYGQGGGFAGESGGMQSRTGFREDQGMRGKGPKNYRRSDDRIREDVCEMLEDADIDASEIDVKVREGEVTLEGSVKDRRSKREAEDVVCEVRGVKDCHNQLRLEQRGQQSSGRGNGRTSASSST